MRGRPSCPVALAVLMVAAAFAVSSRGRAAPTLSHTTNITSVETPPPLGLDFVFLHRFTTAGKEKVVNSPTFALELGILDRLSVGVQYATSSDVNGAVNELEPNLKLRLLRQEAQALDVTVVGAYNAAAESWDGALVARRRLWFLSLFATGRAFSDGFGTVGRTGAAGAGLQVHVNSHLTLIGDINKVLAGADDEALRMAGKRLEWSAGVAFQIPYSPHSVSFYGTNGNTSTLQGASRGTAAYRIGFEFYVPFRNARRWLTILKPREEPPRTGATPGPGQPPAPGAAVVEVSIQDFAFEPRDLHVPAGATVRWVNRDRVAHTATSPAGQWDSGELAPGASWTRTFAEPGAHDYLCTLHPYMTGRIVVEARAPGPK